MPMVSGVLPGTTCGQVEERVGAEPQAQFRRDIHNFAVAQYWPLGYCTRSMSSQNYRAHLRRRRRCFISKMSNI
ncbi:hypothetical protein PILCRDRAFT_812517, partial [Piloderma croceum F 1598]